MIEFRMGCWDDKPAWQLNEKNFLMPAKSSTKAQKSLISSEGFNTVLTTHLNLPQQPVPKKPRRIGQALGVLINQIISFTAFQTSTCRAGFQS